MRKSKPNSSDETYFDSLKKKLLNQKIIVFVIIFTIIVSGIAIFIGNVEQIGKFFSGNKDSINQANNLNNQDSNNSKTSVSLTNESSHRDSAKKKMESTQNTSLNKSFESPPAHITNGMQGENNPGLGIASIKIQDDIEWKETVFTTEEKNKIIRIKNQKHWSEEMHEYAIFDSRYLKKCDQIFELYRYKEYIDPCFDIILLNNGQSPQILSRIGIEIEEAYFTVFSLGDIESKKVNVMGKYELEFPSPEKINVYGDIINLKKNNLVLHSHGNYISIIRDDDNDTMSVKTTTGRLIDYNSLYSIQDFSYADLPKTVLLDLNDPIYIDKNQTFRFLLRITKSQYIPTATLIKFIFKTDKGIKLSKPIYLLKP